MMKTYWLVESSYYKSGDFSKRLVGSIQAEKCPEPKKEGVITNEETIYLDWFDNRHSAELFVRDAREDEPVSPRGIA